jgi:hypothetical protein
MRTRVRVAALLAGLLAATPLVAVSITRGPYLGRPDDVSMDVVWVTDAGSSSTVEYAADDGAWAAISDPNVSTRHVVRLSPLIAGGLYRYRVVQDGKPLSETHVFRATRDPDDTTLRFGVIGDTDGVTAPGEIAARLANADVDLVLHTGDVVYPKGEESRYDEQYFRPMAPLVASAPVLSTLGNHDVLTDRGAPYLDDFVLPANDATGDSRFYAFRQGRALFVSVDVESSEFGAGSVQYDWLERTLRNSDALWKFVDLHEPPYSSAESNLAVRMILTPLFESAGVASLRAHRRNSQLRRFRSGDRLHDGRRWRSHAGPVRAEGFFGVRGSAPRLPRRGRGGRKPDVDRARRRRIGLRLAGAAQDDSSGTPGDARKDPSAEAPGRGGFFRAPVKRLLGALFPIALLAARGAFAQPLLLSLPRDALEKGRFSFDLEPSIAIADAFLDRLGQSQSFPGSLRFADVWLLASWSPVSHFALAAKGTYRWSRYAPDVTSSTISASGLSGAGALVLWSPSSVHAALPVTFRAGYMTARGEPDRFLTVRDGIDRAQFGLHVEESPNAPSRWRGSFDANVDSGFEEKDRPRFYDIWSRLEIGPCVGTILGGELSILAAVGARIASGAPQEGLIFNREQARNAFVGPVIRLDGLHGWAAAMSGTWNAFAVHNSLKGWRVAAAIRRVL